MSLPRFGHGILLRNNAQNYKVEPVVRDRLTFTHSLRVPAKKILLPARADRFSGECYSILLDEPLSCPESLLSNYYTLELQCSPSSRELDSKELT